MKKSFLVSLALLAFSSVSFAKITEYRSIDAIKAVIGSEEIKELIVKHGDISNIKMLETNDKQAISDSVLQNFNVEVIFSQTTPIGLSTCIVKANVIVGLNEEVLQKFGVSASELKAPTFESVVCSK